MTEQMERRIASFMLALKYFGRLPKPAAKFEQQVVEKVIELGYVEEVNGRFVPKGRRVSVP